MQRSSVEKIVSGLNDAGVRYLLVGGLAVVAHGVVRFTADLDIVVDFTPSNLEPALATFTSLGYRPRAPVDIEGFADPEQRRAWVAEKGLTVFSLYSREHAATEVDLFVEPPFDFEAAYPRAYWAEIAPGVRASIVGRDDLIALKTRAGRPQDLEDVRLLRARGESAGD